MRVGSAITVTLCLGLLLACPSSAPAEFSDRARVERQHATGKVTFVGSRPGRPIPRPAGFGAGARPQAVGRAFLEQHASELGLRGRSSLRPVAAAGQPRGATAVRYQQSIDGVDVLGGEFVVQLDRDNNVLSVLGEAEPARAVDTAPAVGRAQAERTAVGWVARAESVHAARLRPSETALRILDGRILGGSGIDRPTLVWAVRVIDDRGFVRRLVLVDADLGVVAESIDETMEALQRRVCDGGNATAAVPCTTPVLQEGGTWDGAVPDVRAAYELSGATYEFFHSRFGRDSLDGQGMPLISTVRFCETGEPCPFANAFWNGEHKQMVYGEGYAAADDVVAHELAHGLTEHTARLFYVYQSGAINESLSDVFGELVDQVTDTASDAPGEKWLLGEDLPGGAIRSMSDPPAFGDPDSMTSPLYTTDDGFADNGGVHVNSGVGNKAAYLITDGGSFGGQTIAGIGLEKAARLFYAVATGFLTSASDYKDLGRALGQACDNLVGSHGFTASDCEQVRRSVQATGMLSDRPEAPDEAECPPGSAPAYLFADDLEGPRRWTPQAGSAWFLPQNSHGEDFDATFATSGVTNIWGYDVGSDESDLANAQDYAIEQDAPVAIPPDAFLSFSHAFMFDRDSSGGRYDGGVVEANAGSGWFDVASGDYTGTIATGYDNPLGGRRAFVGTSGGHRTTVVPLAALAGRTARLRFRIGTDTSFGDYGWFIDDIRIGVCGSPGRFAIDSAASAAAETGGTGSIVVTRSGGHGTATVRLTTGGGTATPGADYSPLARTVTFTAGQTSVSVPLAVSDDAEVDAGETIAVALSEPFNGEIAGAGGTVTIQDDDLGAAPGALPLAPAKLVAKSARVTRRAIRLRIGVPAAGSLRVAGRALKVALRGGPVTSTAARTVAVSVRIPARLRRRLHRRGTIARFTARFAPASGGDALRTRISVRLARRR